MKISKNFLVLLLVFIFIISVVSGCGTEEKVEMKAFTHKEAGYSFTIPIDWEVTEEDELKVVFKSKEKPITFYAFEELGGISIYTPDEISKKAIDEFSKVIKDIKVTRDSYSFSMDKAYRTTFEGKIEDVTYSGKLFVREHDLGIRHYLVFIAPKEEFNKYDSIFEEIARSFKLTKSDLEYYEKLSPHYKKDEKLEEMKEKESEKPEEDNSK